MTKLQWVPVNIDLWRDDIGRRWRLREMSPGAFGHEVRASWQRLCCTQVAPTRKEFEGLAPIDRKLFHEMLQAMPPEDRHKLAQHMAGGGPSWQEESVRLKWHCGCPACGAAPATWSHLLWECPHQNALKAPLQQFLMSWPPCLRHRGILPASTLWPTAANAQAKRKTLLTAVWKELLERKAKWLHRREEYIATQRPYDAAPHPPPQQKPNAKPRTRAAPKPKPAVSQPVHV
eukprot:5442879-Amphidinium_carterae.3